MAIGPDEIAAGERLFRRPWQFVKGVVGLEHLPDGDRAEVAFAGRSNVGKSSIINALVGQHRLARTSNTPGRTQELNYFEAPGVRLYLVDMPGYGFAKAPKEKVAAWTALVKDYLRGRSSLARVVLLVDARHGLKPVDRDIITLLNTAAVSFQVVLTKADKLNPFELARVVAATTEAVGREPAAHPLVVATSAETGTGLPELRAAIAAALVWKG